MKVSGCVLSFLLLLGSTALADTHYVDINNATPSAPYTNWVTAATNIQDAVDAALDGDTVLVNDGVYDSGARVTSENLSRVVITNNISVHSLNGPETTFIVGEGPIGNNAVRGVFMSAGHLAGFTVTNGHASSEGGGLLISHSRYSPYSTVSNCIFVGNKTDGVGGGIECAGRLNLNNCAFSDNEADEGGGVDNYGIMEVNNCTFIGNTSAGYGGGICNFFAIMTLNNCTFIENISDWDGGGIANWWDGELEANNCIFVSNRADRIGGGIDSSDGWLSVNNCTFAYNMAGYSGGGIHTPDDAYNCVFKNNYATERGSDFDDMGTIMYSCSTQLTHGVDGNITNAPLFIGSGDYRLTPNSPCINAGSNGYVTASTDLDDNPRIIDGTVDMGAYEYYLGYVIDCYPVDSGFSVEWIPDESWDVVVKYSTNLVTMPFTDLTAPMPHPISSYTDTVHGAESKCFYKVEMVP